MGPRITARKGTLVPGSKVGLWQLQWGRALLRGKGIDALAPVSRYSALQWGRALLRGKGALRDDARHYHVVLQWGRALLRGKGYGRMRVDLQRGRFNGAAHYCAEKVWR